MNGADAPPGHAVHRFGAVDGPWLDGQVGDIVLQRGPRIGQRLWLVVHVEHHRRWSHVLLKQVTAPEFTQAAIDGGREWYIDRGTLA